MAKTLQGYQTNFTAGELSPRLWGHVDVDKYKNGLHTALNAYCLPHGPIIRRSGTEFINEVKDSTKESRLVRFQFNQDNAFILEFGHQYIRFYKDGGQVLSSAEITNGNFGTDLTGWTDDDTGTGASTQSAGVMRLNGGAAGVAARTQAVSLFGTSQYTLTFTSATNTCVYRIGTTSGGTEIASGTSSLGVNNITFTPTTHTLYIQFRHTANNNADVDSVSLDAPVYQLTTTYTESEVQEFTVVQFARSLYIAHGSHAPATLAWTDDADWTLEDIFFYPPPTDEDGHFDVTNASVTLSAVTGMAQTATASAAAFLPSDVGRQLQHTAGRGVASIIGYTSSTVVTVDILENFPAVLLPDATWKLDLSPIAKLSVDTSVTGSTCTVTSYYTDSFRGPSISISGITVASPAVVTTSANHNLTDGDRVELKNIQGMTQINNTIWGVDVQSATTFNLLSVSGTPVNSLIYTAYTGGGHMRKVYTDIALDSFRSTDVDRYIIVNGGIGLITEVTSATVAKMELQKPLNSLSDTSAWSMEVESWTAGKGFPRTVALHQQRVWFGGTENAPQTVWGSSPAIFDSIGVGPLDDDAIQFDLATSEVNQIQWMYGLRDNLIVGTSGAELTVGSGIQAGPITASSVSADSRTYSGSKLQQVIALENEVLYVQRSGTKLNSFRYNFEIDNFLSDDLAFLAEHLPRNGGGIKQIAYAQDPDRLIYAVLNDGTMMVGTYYRDQKVIAWTLYDTDGEFEAVQTISTGLSDEVWFVVKRSINGTTKRYVERLADVNMSEFGENNIEIFSDCTLTLSNPLVVTGITKANPGVVTSTTHGLSNGDLIKMFNVGGMEEVIGRTYVVANKTANTFELTTQSGANVNTSGFTTFTSGGDLFELFTAVSGLSHLEGKVVEIKADGASHPSKTVSGGAVTLDRPTYELTVGLGYTMNISTLDRELNLGTGSQQGQLARHVHPILKVYKSALPLLNNEFLPARRPQDLMDNKVELRTGNVEYGNLYWNVDTKLTLTLSKPFPFVLLGLYGSIEAGVR